MKKLLLSLFSLIFCCSGFAQSLLDRYVSLDAEQQPAGKVLQTLSTTAQVLFSYNSDLVSAYGKVSVHARHKTVRQVLDLIFAGNLHYKERGKYIILLDGGERSFVISGYIQNGRTGEGIRDATVFESQLLASAMTNEQGYFRLPIKNKDHYKTLSLRVSKEAYTELSLNINAGYDQELTLPIVPETEVILEDVVIHKDKIESTWVSRFFLSSKQQFQALNIRGFMTDRPVQTSVLPGIGTHGMLGSQVVNKFSLNLLGGYTAGVDGAEIGGLFNINKKDVCAVQIAGVFNNVGGTVTGVQTGGLYNHVIGKVNGVQIGGIINRVNGEVNGVQVGGITNWCSSSVSAVQIGGISNHIKGGYRGIQIAGIVNDNDSAVKGIQISGLANVNQRQSKGIQISGLLNVSQGNTTGIQIAGLANRAGHMRGMQIGLINVADTFEGYAIGLVNYSRNGLHNLLISANELQDINVGYRSGTERLYAILSLGMNSDPDHKSYSVSYGIGKRLAHAGAFSFHIALLAQGYYLGDWLALTAAGRCQGLITYTPVKHLSISAGPAYVVSPVQPPVYQKGYMSLITEQGSYNHRIDDNICAWMGWQVGVQIF